LEELQNTPLEETSFTARGENKAAGAEAAAAAMVTEDAIATTQESSVRVQKRAEKMSAFAECVRGQVTEHSGKRKTGSLFYLFIYLNNALSAVEAHSSSYWTTRIPVSDISNKYQLFFFLPKKHPFFSICWPIRRGYCV